jgi:hypothetical protein
VVELEQAGHLELGRLDWNLKMTVTTMDPDVKTQYEVLSCTIADSWHLPWPTMQYHEDW